MFAFFVDLEAAFDSVDKVMLLEAMRKRGIRESLVKRCGDLYRETKNRVRVREEMGKIVWTGRGVKQGCPLSPDLFNLMTADLEEYIKKRRWKSVRLERGRSFTLAYADDSVLLAEEEEGMRGMLKELKRYVKEKELELNVEKSEMMRFKKEKGREKKMKWWWKGKRIEEVKEFKYLEFMFQRNGGKKAHIKDMVRKEAGIMGQIWGIGKRRFNKD